MVKSKKFSKGTLAVIMLSFVLVLSLVLGLSGAWFTDKDEGGSATGDAEFGVVNVNIGAGDCSVTIADKKFVPGDAVATVSAHFQNASNVAIKYCYDIELDVENEDGDDLSSYFTVVGAEGAYGTLAANAAAPAAVSISVTALNTAEDNDLQGETVTITLTLKVYAIQADNTPTVLDATTLKAAVA